jgi:hypothetical protein
VISASVPGEVSCIEVAVRVEREHPQHAIRGDVSLQPVYLRRSADHRKLRHEARARAHSPGKKSTSARFGDMPGGTSEGSSSVIQVLNTLSGNGENDSMDMSLARRKREVPGQEKSQQLRSQGMTRKGKVKTPTLRF